MAKRVWTDQESSITLTADSQKNLSKEIATRERRLDFTALSFYLPNPDLVLQGQGGNVSVYYPLLVDAHVWACVQSRKAGVLSLEWELDRGRSKSREAKAAEKMLQALDIHRVLSEALDAVLWGYQPMEIVWGEVGGLVVPVDVQAKPSEWFVFGADGEMKFLSKEQPVYGEKLPEMKFLCPRNHGSYANPYGERTLSRCFWPVAFKKGGWKFWAVMAEKFGMPYTIGRTPPGTPKAVREDFADALEAIVQDGVAVLDDNQSVELMEFKGGLSSGNLYKGLIEGANAEISKAILGHGGAADSTPGRLGGDDASLAVRREIVDADRRLVEETMNTLLRWFHLRNFSGGEPPRFVLFEEEQIDKVLAERDEILSRGAAKKYAFSKEYLMKAYGFAEEDLVDAPPAPEPPAFQPLEGEAFAEARGARPVPTRTPFTLDFVDQAAANSALRSVLDLQKMVEQAMAAVEDAPDDATPEEVTARIYAAYPKMNADAIVDLMTRAGFSANAAGRASVPGADDAED